MFCLDIHNADVRFSFLSTLLMLQYRASTGAAAVLHELGQPPANASTPASLACSAADAAEADAGGPGTEWDEPVMQYLYRLTKLDCHAQVCHRDSRSWLDVHALTTPP
jgi:hypothetical protein